MKILSLKPNPKFKIAISKKPIYKELMPKVMQEQNKAFIKDYIETPYGKILTSKEIKDIKKLFKSACAPDSDIMKKMYEDADAIIEASKTLAGETDLRKVLFYQTLKSRFYYETSHKLNNLGQSVSARSISEGAKKLTGTEIYPGAKIGDRLFIRHGQGVIIGDTAIIGNDAKIYHGVTLAAAKEKSNIENINSTRRHPQIGNDVLIGCNATILGPITIGDNCKIGAHALVRNSIPPNSTVISPQANIKVKLSKQ